MSTRLFVASTAQIDITPPQALSALTLAATRLDTGAAVNLGQPTNPSGDGLTWTFDPQAAAVPASLLGVPLKLEWTETALAGGAAFVAVEYVTPESGLIGTGPKYTSLGALKAYGRAGALPGGTQQLNEDDPTMLLSIARAEESMDCFTGTAYERRDNLEISYDAFVDSNGWLTCRLFQPIASIDTIEVLDTAQHPAWKTITPVGGAFIDPTVEMGQAPLLASYRFRAYPATQLAPSSKGRYWIRATYTGGYASIPSVIEAVCLRTAWWYCKVRDVPMGTVRDLTNATITIPQDFPKDIKGQMSGWRNLPL
jgi:hypothetical protein